MQIIKLIYTSHVQVTYDNNNDYNNSSNNNTKGGGDSTQILKKGGSAISNWVVTEPFLACVQTSPISFHPRKRDVCETASLIVFQYPAVRVLNFA